MPKTSTILPWSVKGGLLEDGEILHEAVVDDVLYDLIDKIDLSNEGEIPQYYVEDNHEAIIDPDPSQMTLKNWQSFCISLLEFAKRIGLE